MNKFPRVVLLVSLCVSTLLVSPAAPAANQDFVQAKDCSTTSNPICIVEVLFKKPSEKNFTKAVLTGLEIPVDQIGNGGVRMLGVRQEYRTPGVYFEGSNNDKIIPTVEFFRAVTVPCPIASCSPPREVIGVFVNPSGEHDPWQQRLVTSPFRSDSKLCTWGTIPYECTRNLNFQTELIFKMQIQIPIDYAITFIHGLASGFSYALSPSKLDGYTLLSFEFSPIEHSGMLSPTWGTNADGVEGGDYTVDSVALWFFGKNDMWSRSIGPCAGSGAYGVVNNAVEMGEPQWNSQDSTINVRLRAPHVNSRNEVSKGYFGAFISRKMAECLWHLDISTQSSAKLAISYSESGKTEVLTAVSSYKNELFSLESTGFHYSSPTIKVKMEEIAKPAVSASAFPKPSVTGRSISCFKGKSVKRISGVNPKCPKGYKTK